MKGKSSARNLYELKKASQRLGREKEKTHLGGQQQRNGWTELPQERGWKQGAERIFLCKRIPHTRAAGQAMGREEEGGSFMFLINLETQKYKMYQGIASLLLKRRSDEAS